MTATSPTLLWRAVPDRLCVWEADSGLFHLYPTTGRVKALVHRVYCDDQTGLFHLDESDSHLLPAGGQETFATLAEAKRQCVVNEKNAAAAEWAGIKWGE